MLPIYLFDYIYRNDKYNDEDYFCLNNERADDLLETQKTDPDKIFRLLTNCSERSIYQNYQHKAKGVTPKEIESYKKLAGQIVDIYIKTYKYLKENKTAEKLIESGELPGWIYEDEREKYAKAFEREYFDDLNTSFHISFGALLMFNLDLISVNKETFDLSDAYKTYAQALNLTEEETKQKLDSLNHFVNHSLNEQWEECYREDENRNMGNDVEKYLDEFKKSVLTSEEKNEKE